jgi:hypothetical protein
VYSFVLFSFSAEVDFELEDEWSLRRKRCYCPTSFFITDTEFWLCGTSCVLKYNLGYPRWPEFDPRPVHVRFVVDTVALGQFSPRVVRLSPVSITNAPNSSCSTCHFYQKGKRTGLGKPSQMLFPKWGTLDRKVFSLYKLLGVDRHVTIRKVANAVCVEISVKYRSNYGLSAFISLLANVW